METEGSQSALSAADSPHDPCKMFIGGLSWQTTQEGLKEYFCKYGEVKECMVMRDPVTKRSRGFGFVTFVDQAGVDKVLAQTRHELDSKTECWTSGGLVTGDRSKGCVPSQSSAQVSNSDQEDLCGRPVGEHDHRGRQTVLRPVWEGRRCHAHVRQDHQQAQR
uniref:Musashi RNA binding protein 1b n=1 Tax=Sparus aurata TaxID=8175 RepID=A0A671U4D0_SPAAU